MYNILVCFSKDLDDGTVDIQYHYFTDCPKRIDFIHDNIYKQFVHEHGYLWSSIQFPIDLAYQCGFTISKCCE